MRKIKDNIEYNIKNPRIDENLFSNNDNKENPNSFLDELNFENDIIKNNLQKYYNEKDFFLKKLSSTKQEEKKNNNQNNEQNSEKYDDGSIYKGEFKNGVKEGKGNLILHSYKNKGNDLVYNGEFKNNLICGIGSMKINSKKDYYGEWSNNEMNGYGMARDGNLRHYGYFSHGIKEGYGASFYEDQGYVFVGKWEEDLVTGPSILMILDIEEKNADKMIEKENIVGMYKGEIIDMKLGDKDINMFKNSEEYQEMTNLFRNKFYPDFLKYIEEKNNNKNEI